ncbi:MAG TPA: FAD-binding oxidoreductase [Candidatus Saccharimonadales bacterium]|nr:FAD-binding oxidoreductase [Candidatus Saccharimonadales bacterium]
MKMLLLLTEVTIAVKLKSNMVDLKTEITPLIKGEIDDSEETRSEYSHDASMFELVPEVVVYPHDSEDIKHVVRYVTKAKKAHDKHISITARSAGTDMSGGAINQSIILDMTKHFNQIHEVGPRSAHVQPGVFYRDFEAKTLEHKALLPCYPASRELCTVGGMVANNSGGELSLRYGKTEKFVTELKVVLSDGNEYTVKPLTKADLDKKMAQDDFEGRLYKGVFEVLDTHYDEIKEAKPKVSKDSTGYHLWNVWDRDTGVFDLTQLIVGSQGTLGIVTDIHFRLVSHAPHNGTLVMFLRDTSQLGTLINDVMKFKPVAFEGFDNYTLLLSIKLFFFFRKTLGWGGLIKLGLQLLPEALKLFRGIPKMVLLIEFDGETPEEVATQVHALREALKPYGNKALFEEDETEAKSRKFWIMRRESFNLLRKKVKDKHTAPFIDDLVVPPEHLPHFLPELRTILDSYKLLATVAGHMGDGNFHVIPLMKIEEKLERIKLEPAMREVNNLVLSYGGSLSGEHNDGLSRGPWLHIMYSRNIMRYFKEVKALFDPDNIFNPDKKTDAHWEFSMSHIREHF